MLLDHFRPPLSERRHWHSFHNAWATYLSSQINALLPAGYFAESNVQFGIEVDVAAFEERARELPTTWTPPEPLASIPLTFSTPVIEVGIFSRSGGPRLAGAIELVSPANKDRPAARDAFVSKCAAYVQAHVGLVIVDIVTDRVADFHQLLLARLGNDAPPAESVLYASAYRPIDRNGVPTLDVWQELLTLGQPLPTLPLWLGDDFCVPVDLGATYQRTCLEQKVPALELRVFQADASS